jgi:CYTH domain-containing protein
VDVFEGELQGLVICEAEAESPTAIQESAAELKAHSPHERLCCKT